MSVSMCYCGQEITLYRRMTPCASSDHGGQFHVKYFLSECAEIFSECGDGVTTPDTRTIGTISRVIIATYDRTLRSVAHRDC